MFKGQKVVVVMPAYNAEKTLGKTYKEVMDQQIVDEVIVVDDASRDDTVAVALALPAVRIQVHEDNKGYGANQKTCYRLALDAGADIVIMVHPDYQYTPKLIPAMAAIIGNGLYHCVIGSRILGGYALRGGMPLWKYLANRFLRLSENLLVGAKLSEYHSGYRAFSRQVLDHLNLEQNSDDFVFDNQMLIQIIWHRSAIAEVPGPLESVGNQLGHQRHFWFSSGQANDSARPGLPALGDSSLPAVWRELCRVEHRTTSLGYRYLPAAYSSRPATLGQQGGLASWSVLQC